MSMTTFKDKVMQLIKYAKTHSMIQQRFNDLGYTGSSSSSTGFFAPATWTIVPEFDYTKVNNLKKLCYNNSTVTEVRLKNTGNVTDFYQAFYGCKKLKKIETLDISSVPRGMSKLTMFTNCNSLVDLKIEGIISDTFDIKHAKSLSLESAKNIISCLKDYSGTAHENKCAVYFDSAVWDLLNAEGNAAPHGGTWMDYVESLKWKH